MVINSGTWDAMHHYPFPYTLIMYDHWHVIWFVLSCKIFQLNELTNQTDFFIVDTITDVSHPPPTFCPFLQAPTSRAFTPQCCLCPCALHIHIYVLWLISLVDHMPWFWIWKMWPPTLWSCLNGFRWEPITPRVTDEFCLVIALVKFCRLWEGGGR